MKNKIKPYVLFIVFMMILCIVPTGHAGSKVGVDHILFDSDKITIQVGKTIKLEPIILPINATNKKLLWLSDNAQIASVDQEGNITGHKSGKTTITVASSDGKGASAKVKVTVTKPATKIRFTESIITLAPGEEKRVEFEITDHSAITGIHWASSDESIAIVDQNGKITALQAGSCKVAAKTKDGSKAVIDVEIQYVPIDKITVNDKKVYLALNTDWQLDYSVSPENASNKEIVWESSNERIATVNHYGRITAQKKGSCSIKGKPIDGLGKEVKINVEVKDFDVVFRENKDKNVWFTTTSDSRNSGIFIDGHQVWGASYEAIVNISNGCVIGKAEKNLSPIKAGADTVSVVEKSNGKTVIDEKYSVYVAQSVFSDGTNESAKMIFDESKIIERFNEESAFPITDYKKRTVGYKSTCESNGCFIEFIDSTQPLGYAEIVIHDSADDIKTAHKLMQVFRNMMKAVYPNITTAEIDAVIKKMGSTDSLEGQELGYNITVMYHSYLVMSYGKINIKIYTK